MLQAVIFDLDQTLLDRTATFKRFLEKQYSKFQTDLKSVSKNEFISTCQQYDNNGYTAKGVLYARVCNKYSLSISDKLLADFQKEYGKEPILFTNVVAALKTLSSNYKLALITNGFSKVQNAKINNAGIRNYFDVIKISEEEGVKKPNPVIFERCVNQLGVLASQAVYIGDHPEKDVVAAQQFGLQGIWRRNKYYSAPESADGIIDDLSELSELLASLSFS